jgi:hypothetical protein
MREEGGNEGKSNRISNEDKVKKLKSFFFKTVDHDRKDESPKHS